MIHIAALSKRYSIRCLTPSDMDTNPQSSAFWHKCGFTPSGKTGIFQGVATTETRAAL